MGISLLHLLDLARSRTERRFWMTAPHFSRLWAISVPGALRGSRTGSKGATHPGTQWGIAAFLQGANLYLANGNGSEGRRYCSTVHASVLNG